MKVNYGMKVMFAYQRINTEQYFNIMNLQNYDLILGTLLLFQYQVLVRLNGLWIIFGSKSLLPITGEQLQVLESRAANILNDQIDEFWKQLSKLAKLLCVKASEMDLPPLRPSTAKFHSLMLTKYIHGDCHAAQRC